MIFVNNTLTNVAKLHYAEFLQDFFFCHIIYILFNADLVNNKINKNREIIAFINNYLGG